jgi:hypothetical protein
MTGWPVPNLDVWQWLLLFGGAYVAIVSLARLMKQRHDELVAELTEQALEEQRRKQAEEKKSKKAKRKAA